MREFVYVIVTNWVYLLVSKEVARLLALPSPPSCINHPNQRIRKRIFIAIPDSTLKTYNSRNYWIREVQKEFSSSFSSEEGHEIIFEHISYNPGYTRNQNYEAAMNLVTQLQEKIHQKTFATIGHPTPSVTIDGLFYNWHGGIPSKSTKVVKENDGPLLFMAQYKLLGLFVLLDTLINKTKMISKGSRIVVAGSEAARGIPGAMNFPVPKFDSDNHDASVESFISILNGTGRANSDDPNPIYAEVEAILALYISCLARRHPNLYFCTLSPGFTQDSLHYSSSLIPGLTTWISITFFKLIFSYLVKQQIGQDYKLAARRITDSLTGKGDFEDSKGLYPSGIILGAIKGVSGPICDQSTIMPGGQQLADRRKQDYAYKALHHFAYSKQLIR